ncbi:MAG: RNA polymerase sigma factor [Myxococcota bacterium]
MCAENAATPPEPKPNPEVLAKLVGSHRAFLEFVQRRVGDRDTAEEIVQNALVSNLDKLQTVRESAVGWFYAVLRNAIIDYRRRKATAEKRLQAYAADAELTAADDAELHRVVCQCVAELATTLKSEYADALRQIEIEGLPVKDYAERVGISPNNAGVRVFRAREALQKQVVRSCGTCATHGCVDCTCGAPAR